MKHIVNCILLSIATSTLMYLAASFVYRDVLWISKIKQWQQCERVFLLIVFLFKISFEQFLINTKK